MRDSTVYTENKVKYFQQLNIKNLFSRTGSFNLIFASDFKRTLAVKKTSKVADRLNRYFFANIYRKYGFY